MGNTDATYDINANNRYGKVLTYSGIAAEFTNSNPWSNFDF